jgi:hypothetical protein
MEIDILNSIQHPKNPNIIEFIGSEETEYFFYMIFEVHSTINSSIVLYLWNNAQAFLEMLSERK